MKNTIYIYQEPFKGSILNTMHNDAVDYTGQAIERIYTDENGCKVHETKYINSLTFDQYNEKHGGTLKTANEEEINNIFEEFEQKNILDYFTEITEEKYFDLLECLPPKRWHHFNNLEIFFMGECYTSNIYRCCIFDKSINKYFTALRRISETSQYIENIYYKLI